MSNVYFNTIEALIAQEPIGNLMQIKDIVDKEIQFCRDNMIKQASQQKTANIRAIPRMEDPRMMNEVKNNEFDNLKTQAGIGAVDPRIQAVGTGISDAGQESLRANYQDKLHISESGATSSHVPLRYDLIPRSLLEVAAIRYTDGAKKHGERGYQKGLADRGFIINRINHIAEHWNKLFHPDYRKADNPEAEEGISIKSIDDNLGAIIWGLGFLCEVMNHKQGVQILLELRSNGRVKVTTD